MNTYVLQNVINALSLGSLYALFALGIALIFGIMQLINFAHGELIMIAGYALVVIGHPPWPVAILGVLLIVIGAALLMERIAFRPVRGATPATLLVTSFAVSYFLQNLAILTFTSRPKGVGLSPVFTQFYQVGSFTVPKLNVLIMVVTFGLLIGLALFLKKTPIGIQMRASAEDFGMARLLGVRANTVIATAFAISGLLAAVAGLLLTAQQAVLTPLMGVNPVIVAFVATVIGGMGSLSGAVLGGFILGGLTVGFQASLPIELRSYRDAFAYSIVIAILVFRPQGLVVTRAMRTRV
jgi:branched-chain amino acid transport system permease protein